MTSLTDKSDLRAWLLKASTAIYIATDPASAEDISDGLIKAFARIAELEAQVTELGKGESREWVKSDTLDRLQARIVDLEATLQPFAKWADYVDERKSDDYITLGVQVAHLLAARTVWKGNRA